MFSFLIPVYMAYKYNNTRIKEFAEAEKIGGRTIANRMNMSNDLAPRGWIACTEKIYMHHFINFVNTFGLDIHEFFYEDGVLMSDTNKDKNRKCSSSKNAQTVPTDTTAIELAHVKEMVEVEKKHIREMMQKEVEFSRKEIELRKQIRQELKEEFNTDKQQIINSYEARLTDRDNTIARLQQQLSEEAQKGEKGFGNYRGTYGVAEETL